MLASADGHARRRCVTPGYLIAIVTIVFSCLALIAPRQALAQHRASAAAIDTGTVTFVGTQLAGDIDPASNESEFGATVIRNIDENLVRLAGSSGSSFAPALATSWSSNAAKSVWVFHLRHGVHFHSGNLFTAADVKYSLARSVLAQQAGAYMLQRFLPDPMKEIKIIDPYTVEFDLGQPQQFFLNGIAQDYNALILDSKLVKAHEVNHDWGHAWATRHDAGSGPYTIASWVADQNIVLKAFPGYWGGWSGRHFSKVVLQVVPDSTTRRELLERGQANVTYDLTRQDNDALKKNPNVTVVAPFATELRYIVMTEAGPLASPYARQALSYAFPYDAYINGITGSAYAKRSYGCLASTLLGFDPNVFKYHTDLNMARALLQKAGVKPGTTLTYTYADPDEPPGELLQAQLAQIGITLKLQHLTGAAFYNVIYGTAKAAQRPNLLAYGWWPDYNDPYDECNTLLNSNQAPPNGSNIGFYHNAQVDSLLNAMATDPIEKLVSDAHKLQDITSRVDPPAIWYSEPAETTVFSSNIRGYVFNPIELRTFYFYEMYRS